MTTKDDGRDLPYTLDQADRNLQEILGRPAGFADTVRRLADVKAAAKQLKERRETVWKQVKSLHGGGTGVRVVRGGAGGWVLRPVTSQRTAVRKAYSAAVKEADPVLWQRCLVPKRVVTLTVPKDHVAADLGLRMPALPYRSASPVALIEAYRSSLYTDQLRDLTATESDLKLALDKLAAEIEWSGEQYRFVDGWRVQLVQQTFDGEQLRTVDPDAFERLSVVVVTGGVTKLTITDYATAVVKGLVDDITELDEIDGH